jgi:hypothetical protein
MKQLMIGVALLALPVSVAATELRHTPPSGFDIPEIRERPIAGVYNKSWYNYRADILEAEKELESDLKRATDREDRFDAWDEWVTEVVDADKDYVKEMRKRGYRAGRVTIG